MQMLVSRRLRSSGITRLTLLRRSIVALDIREVTQQLERPCSRLALFPRRDPITAAEDLDLVAGEAKLLGQADGLTVAGSKTLARIVRRLRIGRKVYTTDAVQFRILAATGRVAYMWSKEFRIEPEAWAVRTMSGAG
jgi:hypothetical protein